MRIPDRSLPPDLLDVPLASDGTKVKTLRSSTMSTTTKPSEESGLPVDEPIEPEPTGMTKPTSFMGIKRKPYVYPKQSGPPEVRYSHHNWNMDSVMRDKFRQADRQISREFDGIATEYKGKKSRDFGGKRFRDFEGIRLSDIQRKRPRDFEGKLDYDDRFRDEFLT